MLIIGPWFLLGDYIGDGYWKCEDRFTESARSNLLESLLGSFVFGVDYWWFILFDYIGVDCCCKW